MPFNPAKNAFYLGGSKGAEVTRLSFPKDKELIAYLCQHMKAKWSQSQKCRYVPDVAHDRNLFGLEQKSI